MPGGERIKKKVIDIHFNPQLSICHSFLQVKHVEPYSMRQTMKVDIGDLRGRETMKDRWKATERDLSFQSSETREYMCLRKAPD